jgi:hypothetical protein
MRYILRIEHPIFSFEDWKRAFDSDPVGREKAGVRRYQVLRPVDDEKYVMIDLEFDSAGQAEALLAALRALWGRPQRQFRRRHQLGVQPANARHHVEDVGSPGSFQ